MNKLGQEIRSIKGPTFLNWSKEVGKMHWRNNIVANRGKIFFGTSGNEWNQPDSEDAIWCVDAATGSQLWRCEMHADVNEVSLIGNFVVAGTDGGEVAAIDQDSGEKIAVLELDGPIFAKPIEINHQNQNVGVIISHAGNVIIFDPGKREFLEFGETSHNVRANPVTTDDLASKGTFVVGTEENEVIVCRLTGNSIEKKAIYNLGISKSSFGKFQLKNTGIQSLVISGKSILVSFTRDTYDKRPPLICLDLMTGEFKWQARTAKTISKKDAVVGNCRIRPVVWKNLVISTFSYSGSLHAFDINTGLGKWRITLDAGFFQNWSSPLLSGDYLYVPRINGVISKIDLVSQNILETASVETANSPSPATSLGRYEARDGEEAYPNQRIERGLCSSPTMVDGAIIVGTASGNLLSLSL